MKSRVMACLFALMMLSPLAASSQVSVVVAIRPPPPLPVYVQPPVPAPGYLWTPGYWGWSVLDGDYYWVPGTWVLAPMPGYLWTPGYWGYYGGSYRWNAGYWGTYVGFYGGINYGFGYVGSGYQGGRWKRGVFQYNQAVNNVNTTVVRNVYNTKVVNVTNVTNVTNVNRVSFNGGSDGVNARPTRHEEKVKLAKHLEPTPDQLKHEDTASKATTQKASVNRGVPQVAATPRPAELDAPGAARASNKDTLTANPPAGAAARPQDQSGEKHGAKQARREAQPATTQAPTASVPPAAPARPGKPETVGATTSPSAGQDAARREPKAAKSAQTATGNGQRSDEQRAARQAQSEQAAAGGGRQPAGEQKAARQAQSEQAAAGGGQQSGGGQKAAKGERSAARENSNPQSPQQSAQLK